MLNKRKKKNMYVPDEEVLAYNRAKDEEPVVSDATIDSEDAADEAIESNQAEPIKEDSAVKVSFIKKVLNFFPNKNDTPKNLIIKIVAIIAAIALIVTGTYLSVYFIDLGHQDAKINNIRNDYELHRDDYTKNQDNQFAKFNFLKTQNKDIVGWVTIPNTEVNNPVYQTYDNEFYVTHDMEKKPNSYGALFLDYRCDVNPMSLTRNQIIYGHNMRYGAMFGTLDEYRELSFYKENPLIHFDSLYEKRVYKIFAIMIVNDGEDETFGYNFTAYRSSFLDDTDFMTWIDHCRQRSLVDTTVDINANDEIITMSTCCYDYEDARLVVLGRLVRPNEDEAVNTADAAKNEDVIYSGKYYAKKKLPVPKIEEPTESDTTSSDK